MRSKLGAAGATLYLLACAGTYAYPYFNPGTFSGVAMVMLALPWIDYLPGVWLGAVVLNALIIYLLLATLSWLFSLARRLVV
jgi:hypothetical protein